MLLGLTTF
jgi:hypothetical protein